MATPTYELIETVTLTADAGGIDFSSIPTTDSNGNDFGDLIFFGHIISNGTTIPHININDLDGTTHKFMGLTGDGTNDSAGVNNTSAIAWSMGDGGVSGKTAFGIFEFLDYTATNKSKAFVGQAGGIDAGQVRKFSGRVDTTSAITKIAMVFGGLGAGSTFSLYGIVK